MAPKKARKAKKGQAKNKKAIKIDMKAVAAKPRKIPPPPPACFKNEDIAFFKEMFKFYDEEGIERIRVSLIPALLRKIGFNPSGAEIQQLLTMFLEDVNVELIEFHEVLLMIEAKMNWGDPYEQQVMEAMGNLGNDETHTKFIDFEVLREELFKWGEPLTDIEFSDWIKQATKNKTYDVTTRAFAYEKFVDLMNARDVKFVKEPLNFFKMDQKTLAELAVKKVQEEKEAQERKEAEKAMREEARRIKLLAEGLIQEENQKHQEPNPEITL